jgi:GntR family transcriptional repressor for pyruvate dehydrogenase complex
VSPRGILHRRVAEDVARILRQNILNGDYGDASLPKQEDLLAEFGVSAASLREALRILESEGLLTVRRGNIGGAVVHLPLPADTAYAIGLVLQAERVTYADLGLALAAFEPMAAAYCAQRADRENTVIPLLHDLLDESEGLIDQGGIEWSKAARSFHVRIAELCGSATIKVVIASLFSLWGAEDVHWHATNESELVTPDRRMRIIFGHREIVKAIASGDSSETERVARAHMVDSLEFLHSRPNATVNVTNAR